MTYNPHQAISHDFLSYFRRVTRKNGYHCVFPYGWKLADKAAYIHDTLREPLYDGWTFRVFFCAMDPVQSDAAVQIGWDDVDPSKYVIRAEVRGGRPSVTGYTHNADISDQFVTNNIKQDVTKWHYKITPSSNIITSIHVYDNLATAFPDNGLGEEFLLNPVPLGVGSYGIFNLKYGSGSGDLTIAFNDGNNRKSHHYVSAKLITGEIFSVYIRNTPAGWLIYTSFQATPDLVVREAYHNLISPIFSPAGILSINMHEMAMQKIPAMAAPFNEGEMVKYLVLTFRRTLTYPLCPLKTSRVNFNFAQRRSIFPINNQNRQM
ncbi:uncharacterized protein [Dermacentor albipictus]|uniref:uncharacterized protein isoform X2 n=1 Tax=Dermacentor albipictus TaxID=60249 RepID=UPI0031FC9517